MSQLQSNVTTPSPLRMQVPETHGSQSPLLNHQPHQDPPTPTPSGGNVVQTSESPAPIPFPRLSTEHYPSGYPRRRPTNEASYWGPPPPGPPPPARSYAGDGYELQRRAPESNNPYHDYEQYSYGELQPLTTQNDYSVQGYDTPQYRARRQSYSTRPRHNKANSLRSLRFDPKRRSYHFDTLSDREQDSPPRRRRTQLTPDGTPPEEILRLPLTWWMNSNAKNHFVATMAEFVGTTLFLFFAFAGTQVANIGAGSSTSTTNASNGFSPIVLMYISVCFGFSLMVNVWIFFRISGGLFNPAVTLAMVMVKSVTYVRGLLLVAAQISGSLLASVLVRALFPTPFNVRTTLSDGTSLVRGVFIEALLTSELVFTIFMLAKEKHRATYMAPVGIGLALFVAELVGVYYTGGSLNPARSFGPCAVTGVWDQEHWVYWVGPAVGAIIAVGFYRFIKILEYEVANPGQDAKSEEEEHDVLPRSRKMEEEGM
ncbi:hypothetical protein MBLNU459_g6325t1 [Dothideomycetes sp. NU459]